MTPSAEADHSDGAVQAQPVRIRLSIALMMTIVGLTAADIALFREFWGGAGPSAGYLSMVLPMANGLILALPRLRRPGVPRRFWTGYQIVGWSMVLLLGVMDRSFKDALFYPYFQLKGLLPSDESSPGHLALGFEICMASALPAQVFPAWLGGWLASFSARYGVTIPRR